MEDLLKFFKNNKVAIQITLDIGKKPTVHAITKMGIVFADGETVVDALENMKKKLFI